MKCIRMLLNGYQRTSKIKRNIIRMEKLEKTENFEERLHQKRYVTEASGKKSTSRASLRELKKLILHVF